MQKKTYTLFISIIVALGGFLLGFDSALISGAVPFIRDYFELTELQLGWAASAVILGAIFGNIAAGPLSNAYGRKKILLITAFLFTVSAITSATATVFWFFIVARILGGIGVGMAILIAPVYISEIAPPGKRGKLVSINQLNIVIGISLSFFSNRLIYEVINNENAWRWMLGVETLPALLFLIMLVVIPESPRWLFLKGKAKKAEDVIRNTSGAEKVEATMREIKSSLSSNKELTLSQGIANLLHGKLLFFLLIGIGIGMLQQFSGINSIYYYAPEIFEKAGASRDSALLQSIVIGVTSLVFTILAMRLIDRIGRKPLLIIGSAGMFIAHLILGITFSNADYKISNDTVNEIEMHSENGIEILKPMEGISYPTREAFLNALQENLTPAQYDDLQLTLLKKAIKLNTIVVLAAIILFVSSFSMSIGPVMWVFLSEIYPNHVRGVAISITGFFNSIISFSVTLLFPRSLEVIGEAGTFYIFAALMLLTVIYAIKLIPETKGKSLEEIEFSITKS